MLLLLFTENNIKKMYGHLEIVTLICGLLKQFQWAQQMYCMMLILAETANRRYQVYG